MSDPLEVSTQTLCMRDKSGVIAVFSVLISIGLMGLILFSTRYYYLWVYKPKKRRELRKLRRFKGNPFALPDIMKIQIQKTP